MNPTHAAADAALNKIKRSTLSLTCCSRRMYSQDICALLNTLQSRFFIITMCQMTRVALMNRHTAAPLSFMDLPSELDHSGSISTLF